MAHLEILMARVEFQKLHDVLQELIMASSKVHLTLTADFPEVREKIREWVTEGEYDGDPLTRLFDATEEATRIVREMERLPRKAGDLTDAEWLSIGEAKIS